MTNFDQFNFEKRELAIRQLRVLVEQLATCSFNVQLLVEGKAEEIVAKAPLYKTEEAILEFALNHFGAQSYRYEARDE